MQHEYTEQQLDHAMGASHDITGDDDILEVSFEGIRAFLNSLPEPDPQDDWEACEFADIRKGDRVKEVVNHGHGTIEAIEGVAHFKAPGIGGHLAWKPRGSVYQLALDDHESDSHKVTLYRIPAPVVAPDPVEHPVIYVRDSDIVNFVPKIMVWYRDAYVAGRQGLSPEQITDWQQIDPAKVVADND